MRWNDQRQLLGLIAAAFGILQGCGSEFTEVESDPSETGSCNGPGAFSDSYDDGVLDDLFRSAGTAGAIEERDGVIAFAARESYTDARRVSRFAVDLRGSAAVIEVPRTLEADKGKQTYLALDSADGSGLWMGRLGNDLRLEVRDGEAQSSNSTSYDAGLHRWWRIAERQGVVSFDTGPDGVSWDTQYQAPAPVFVQSAYLTLGISDDGQGELPREAQFDNLNPQGGSFCRFGDLTLSSDGPLDRDWGVSQRDDCTPTIVNGKLEAFIPVGHVGECVYATWKGFALRGQSVTFSFSEMPPAAEGTRVTLGLRFGDTDNLTFSQENGQLSVSTTLGTVKSSGGGALGPGPAWLRIRDTDGRLVFEASNDGTNFESMHELIVDSLPEAFDVQLRLHAYRAVVEDSRLVLDRIN